MKQSEFLNQSIKKIEELGALTRQVDQKVTEVVNWIETNLPDEWDPEGSKGASIDDYFEAGAGRTASQVLRFAEYEGHNGTVTIEQLRAFLSTTSRGRDDLLMTFQASKGDADPKAPTTPSTLTPGQSSSGSVQPSNPSYSLPPRRAIKDIPQA